MKVVLTDGSGLTSRQVASRLHQLGHTVGVLSSDPFGLSRFTRSVRHWHSTPPFGSDPIEWLAAAMEIARRGRYDVLFPTQEQVAVLSWAAERGLLDGVPTVVPAFDALRAVQDKVASRATLDRLGIPQPHGAVFADIAQLRCWDRFPAFVKTPIGTASTGVRRVESPAELAAVSEELDALGVFVTGAGGVVVQVAVPGPLAMIQAVFDRARMVAFHVNLRVREGAGGGASHKQSMHLAGARTAIEQLGHSLSWHGAVSADAIITADGFRIIDVNPRLVEPGNALRAGVDLVGAMLDIATGHDTDEPPVGQDGVRTHQLLLALLGAARDRGRRGVASELVSAIRHSGDYTASTEELTPITRDWRAAIPLVAAATSLVVSPATWQRFAGTSVDNYAITPQGWATLCGTATTT